MRQTESGGILVAYRRELKKGVEIRPFKSSERVWVKLKEFFKRENDLYICFVYVVPEHSDYNIRVNPDMMNMLKEDIVELPCGSDVLLMGDFNARTDVMNETNIAEINDEYVPELAGIPDDKELPQRKS